MDYKLHITEQAVEQLDWIISYLVSNLKNPTAARKLLSEIEIIYSYLESDPHIYPQCDDPFLRTKGYHKATVNHFQYVTSIRKVKISHPHHGPESFKKIFLYMKLLLQVRICEF